MSPFSRLVPPALCCFFISPQQDEPDQPASVHRTQQTVPRQPVPYAMINVPHEPELTDVQTFRRLFTESPACPHGDTPIAARPRRPKPKGSLDLEYTFNSGSPTPLPKKSTSLQKISNRIRQRLSDPYLGKKSSTDSKSGFHQYDKSDGHTLDPISDSEAVMLGASAQSTGMSDLLRSRNDSGEVYDSDAKAIQSPLLQNAIGTFKSEEVVEESATRIPMPQVRHIESVDDEGYHKHSVDTPRRVSSAARKARSSPFPYTPERTTFSQALQVKPEESATATLQRLSAGIASGSIKPPTDSELRGRNTSVLHKLDHKTILPVQPPSRTSSIPKDPDTPQTAVKMLSERLYDEKKNDSEERTANKLTSMSLERLDPVVFGDTSKSSPEKLVDSVREAPSPRTAFRNSSSMFSSEHDQQVMTKLPATSRRNSCLEMASTSSNVPSEQPSVHLFDMQISQRLANKSTVTMLSPATSGNVSRKSLDTSPHSSTANTSLQQQTYIRAEHNRRPSDPHTRSLFEGPSPLLTSPSRHNNSSLRASKASESDADDASSRYTDGRLPSSSSLGVPVSFDGANGRYNRHSLAVGGRSASIGMPSTRSSVAQHLRARDSGGRRRVSLTHVDLQSRFDVASSIINVYSHHTDRSTESYPVIRQTVAAALKDSTTCAREIQSFAGDNTELIDLNERQQSPEKMVQAITSLLTIEQRSGGSPGSIGDVMPMASERRNSTTSSTRQETISPLAESATDLWIRIYRDVHKQSAGPDLLSTPTTDCDNLRRPRSASTLRLRQGESDFRRESPACLKRSSSAGPEFLSQIQQEWSLGRKTSRTMRRLSFLHLKPQRSNVMVRSGPRKLRKRSTPQSLRASTIVTTRSRPRNFRVGNTPPLNELLSIWGSFPSHDRCLRNGSAGEVDNVRARDFGNCKDDCRAEGEPITPLTKRASTGVLAAFHSTLKKLSTRSTILDRHGTQSMSLPTTQRDRGQKYSKAIFLRRFRRAYHTKSSEWRGYRLSGAQRSSISVGAPVEYPELEVFPGEGLLAQRWDESWFHDDTRGRERQRQTSSGLYKIDLGSSSYDDATPTRSRREQQGRADVPDLRRTSECLNAFEQYGVSEDDPRTNLAQPMQRTIMHAQKSHNEIFSGEGQSKVQRANYDEQQSVEPRKSRDLRMPGSFDSDG